MEWTVERGMGREDLREGIGRREKETARGKVAM